MICPQPSPLQVELNPPRGYWKGRAFPLSPYQAQALHLLVTQPIATHDALELVATSWEATSGTVKLIIHKLRKILQPWAAIESVYGKGWRLIIHEKEQAMLKDQIIEHANTVPDDALAAMTIVKHKDGQLQVVPLGSGLPMMLGMLGETLLAITGNLQPGIKQP